MPDKLDKARSRYRRRSSFKYRALMVRVGQALTGLPTLLPRAPAFMGEQERELNEKIVDPYYNAIARARGIILMETNIKPRELEER